MRLAPRTALHPRRVAGVVLASGVALLTILVPSAAGAADTSTLAVVVDGHGAAFAGTVEVA